MMEITGVCRHTAQGHVVSPSQETGGDPVTWAVTRSRLHTAGIRWLRGNSDQFPRPGLEEAAAGRPSARPTSSNVTPALRGLSNRPTLLVKSP